MRPRITIERHPGLADVHVFTFPNGAQQSMAMPTKAENAAVVRRIKEMFGAVGVAVLSVNVPFIR
jgi:hypothetical protein